MQVLNEIITESDIAKVLDAIELQEVRPASDWCSKLLLPDPSAQGRMLPWGKAHGKFDLRPGEVTIWAGENGAGKSGAIGQVIAWQQPRCRAMIASMEMPPVLTLRRMANQMFGGPAPREFAAMFADWTGYGEESRLFIYDQLDTVPAKKILAVTRLAAERLRLHDIVIDSLTKCGVSGRDKYDQQIAFVDRLAWIAKSTGVHIHLICHLRKGEDQYGAPNKWDVRGPGELTDLVDNVVLMWRNRAKEEAEEAVALDKTVAEDIAKQCDVYLKLGKQRHFPWEGTLGLYFDKRSGQLTPRQDRAPMPWPAAGKPVPFEYRAADAAPDRVTDEGFEEF